MFVRSPFATRFCPQLLVYVHLVGDELFSLPAPPLACYSTRSTMDNSLLTPPSLTHSRNTNFDGTKLPLVVGDYQTTTNGMNLALHNFCSPLQKGEGLGVRLRFLSGSIESALLCYCEIDPQ
jgi:hypothetical protein